MVYSQIINIISVIATALATILLAILTQKYVKLTHYMLNETRLSKQPNIYVDLEISNWAVKFLIGNSGSSPARQIQFEVHDNIPWNKNNGKERSLSEIAPIKNGISYLAPNRVLKYIAGFTGRQEEMFSNNSYAEIKLCYKSESGDTFHREFVIYLNQYSGVLFESFRSFGFEIADAIKESEIARTSSKNSSALIETLSKKNCPICGENISRSALKCPKCHEFLKTDDDSNINSTKDKHNLL